jgi:hypothetical protein
MNYYLALVNGETASSSSVIGIYQLNEKTLAETNTHQDICGWAWGGSPIKSKTIVKHKLMDGMNHQAIFINYGYNSNIRMPWGGWVTQLGSFVVNSIT